MRKNLKKPPLSNKVVLHIQNMSTSKSIPKPSLFKRWGIHLLQHIQIPLPINFIELTVRIVNKRESAALNEEFRKKKKPTNVLSFPLSYLSEEGQFFLGDIVMCAPVIFEEAKQQKKTVEAHFAHLTIHGILHLLGYDHVKKKEAVEMETLEKNLMRRLGYPDPYGDE